MGDDDNTAAEDLRERAWVLGTDSGVLDLRVPLDGGTYGESP
jgi:hypothetical protein